MNIHYTGIPQEVTPKVRKNVEARLRKLKKVLGPRPTLETYVVMRQERHLHLVEISINLRDHTIMGEAATPDPNISLSDALNHLEKQALKARARWRVKNRHARPVASRSIRTRESVLDAPAVA